MCCCCFTEKLVVKKSRYLSVSRRLVTKISMAWAIIPTKYCLRLQKGNSKSFILPFVPSGRDSDTASPFRCTSRTVTSPIGGGHNYLFGLCGPWPVAGYHGTWFRMNRMLMKRPYNLCPRSFWPWMSKSFFFKMAKPNVLYNNTLVVVFKQPL